MRKKLLFLFIAAFLILIFFGSAHIRTLEIKEPVIFQVYEKNRDISKLPESKNDKSRKKIERNRYKNLRSNRNSSEKARSSPNKIFVKYKEQLDFGIQSVIKIAVESSFGIQEVKHFSFIDVHLYKTHWDKEQTLLELNQNPYIEYAEPDYMRHAYENLPNDPSFDDLWGLHNTGQTGGTEDADIDAPEAWDLTTGSQNVIVGVIDTGVDYDHQDLQGNLWTNSGEVPNNGIDDDGNGYVDDYYGINAITDSGDPMDDEDHGTHCSGTVAARGDNGTGVVGVCWEAEIMALKFLDSSGSGYDSDAIKCIEYAIDKGAHILSNSWGGGGYNQSLKTAIESAKNAGILFIAAAGNDGIDNDSNPEYPASYDSTNIISVAATNHRDELASWSNYGATTVDVGAPGANIKSTILNNGYDTWNGTSMATPHVAGVAALVKAYNSSLNWEQIKDRILDNVDQKSSLTGNVLTGGRINARSSLVSGSSTISGNVETSENQGIEGALISFSDGGGSATTDSSGYYSQSVTNGWTGTATPSKTGYTFSPSYRSYSNVSSDQVNQDFTGATSTFTVSGTVSLDSNGSGLNGVVMNGLPGNPSTDSSGDYSAVVDYGWSGTVTPSKTDFNFSPSSRTYSSVTLNQRNQDYTASAVNYTLNISVNMGGTTDPSPGIHSYEKGTEVILTAIADDGYRFSRWSGDASGTGNPITVTMDSDKTVTASFIRLYTLTVTAGEGGTTDPVPGDHIYDEGTVVTLTATADNKYRFGEWSGGASGTGNPITVTMNSDKTVTASFIRLYTLTVTAGEGGTTDPVPGDHIYDEGTIVMLTALPDTHFRFRNWSGNSTGVTNPLPVLMDSDKAITANYIRIIYPPLNFSVQKVLNRSLSQAEYINILAWQAHPDNVNIVKYKIYQGSDENKVFLIELNSDQFDFWHRNVKKDELYKYILVAVNNEGREGDLAYAIVQ